MRNPGLIAALAIGGVLLTAPFVSAHGWPWFSFRVGIPLPIPIPLPLYPTFAPPPPSCPSFRPYDRYDYAPEYRHRERGHQRHQGWNRGWERRDRDWDD